MLFILLYILMTLSLFIVQNIYYQIIMAAAISLLLLSVPFSRLKRGLIPIGFFLFFTFVGNLFFQSGRIIYETGLFFITDDGLRTAVMRTLRVYTMICSAKILTASLSLEELVRTMERMLQPLAWLGLPVRDFFHIMALTVKTLPVLSGHVARLYAEDLKKSGISGFRGRLRHLAAFIMPVFVDSISSPEIFFTAGENGTRA